MPSVKLPHLTEDQVRDWTDARSFSRGQEYARSDAVINPRIQGATLKAECWGSGDTPYRVEVTVADPGVLSAICSCPVGISCKHAVAVLLTWLRHPERFSEEEDLRSALSRRSHEELIRIIFRIIERYPAAADIASLPLPGESVGRRAVDADAVRRQVKSIVFHTPHEWGASYAAAAEVSQVVGPGREYAAAGDWGNAAVIYATVADTILEDYDQIYEEEGEYLTVVGECAEGLADCLRHTEDPDERQGLLETLFHAWRWDIDFGGSGVGDAPAAAMLDDTTAEEKAMLADWVRALLPATGADSFISEWRKGALGGFLLQLEADRLDDETFLRICRETGRTPDLVERLLALGRDDEAEGAARQLTSDYALLSLADLFQAAGRKERFAGLIRERISPSRDTRLHDWLIDYEMGRQHFQAALDLARQLIAIRPSLEAYHKVQAPAQALGAWGTERAAQLNALEQAGHHDLRVHIFLDEGEIDLALEALAVLKQQVRFHSHQTDLEVARAAEATRPDASIAIYIDIARRLINERGRDNYAAAASYLARVRDLLRKAGQSARWKELIAQIREENRRLPALRKELDQAGL
jgi:hypothetical protein